MLPGELPLAAVFALSEVNRRDFDSMAPAIIAMSAIMPGE
jgi:hypothetical protein